ncbi:hypothetical protein IMZ48_38605 [Candidatus Bathyarchaeota archaeon]|nr:hypothetical protein [Candidatus Bathyarchaeota archaeon]
MATELTVQSERAFQKQPHIFQNAKSKVKTSRPGKGGRRWYKDVGLGFKTPKNAIEDNYIGMSRPGMRRRIPGCGRLWIFRLADARRAPGLPQLQT